MKKPKKLSMEPSSSLQEVRVEGSREKPRRHTHDHIYVIEKGVAPKISSMSSDYVYVNSAYRGSLTTINERRGPVMQEPPTSVIREQYWTCSKWPFGQRILAIAVGVLIGTVVGLALTMFLRFGSKDEEGFSGIFRLQTAPD